MEDNQKIYIFSYGTVQDPLFYENLFHKDVIKHKAVLNGFAKCIDDSMYFLLKKDQLSSVEGTVFEITKDELFLVDRWEMFPQYGRFLANVLLTDENKVLENVYVYSKLEFGKYYLAPTEMKYSNNPNANEQNLKGFIELENELKSFPLYNFIFMYEIKKEIYDYFEKLTHPYFALTFSLKERKEKIILQTMTVAFKDKDKYYVGILMLGRKDFLNAINYYEIFYDLDNHGKFDIEFTPLYDTNMDFSIFKNNKPNYVISLKEDSNINESIVGVHEKAFEITIKNFDIDPWKRFNYLLSVFFDFKEKNKL